ncbi:beta propeller repeat protein [Bacteroides pyogenes]|jgi:hypothetical protein|uniref:Exo-alpha-sialidase n=1 Tax=Bacteroides pyogenes TaxID=310300 RepID=A0A5D3EAN2_9BACE|nr:hypothetical protein [Bacteroides pyogenes]TYK32848.1 hypothetical protein FNJ60_10585 [Bacteroides pyogenes]
MSMKSIIVIFISFSALFSCVEDYETISAGKNVHISTEVSIDGEDVSSTRASSVAGYTSGDGLYHQGEPFTVAAHANQGYELIRFYERTTNDKKFTGKSSYEGEASIDLVFKAEFKQVNHFPNWRYVKYGNGKFIVTSMDGSYTTSSDGVNWSKTVKFETPLISTAFGNGKFVATTSSHPRQVRYSSDGINWSSPSNVSIASYLWNYICFCNGRFFVIDVFQGWLSTSRDGVNWENPYHPGSSFPTGMRSITYGAGKYVALRTSGSTSISTDGKKWKNAIFSDHGNFRSIAYGAGLFVSVGANQLCYSSDADHFYTKKEFPFSAFSIIYAKNKFWAVGEKGYIAFSKDGIKWIDLMTVGNSNWMDIAFGNGKFIAVGEDGCIATSTDGESWTLIQHY